MCFALWCFIADFEKPRQIKNSSLIHSCWNGSSIKWPTNEAILRAPEVKSRLSRGKYLRELILLPVFPHQLGNPLRLKDRPSWRELRNPGFDIENRRSVHCIQSFQVKAGSFDLEDSADRRPDLIRTVLPPVGQRFQPSAIPELE